MEIIMSVQLAEEGEKKKGIRFEHNNNKIKWVNESSSIHSEYELKTRRRRRGGESIYIIYIVFFPI